MMGSWKSTVGRKLAEALKLEFIDTDDAIEEMTEMNAVLHQMMEKKDIISDDE